MSHKARTLTLKRADTKSDLSRPAADAVASFCLVSFLRSHCPQLLPTIAFFPRCFSQREKDDGDVMRCQTTANIPQNSTCALRNFHSAAGTYQITETRPIAAKIKVLSDRLWVVRAALIISRQVNAVMDVYSKVQRRPER